MLGLQLNPELASLQQQWGLEDITTAFFKCTRWQREDTMDAINCPYHYFCDSTYPGHYPATVDVSVLVVVAVSYLSSLVLAVTGTPARRPHGGGRPELLLLICRKYLLPSGPVVLPLLLLALANGHRTGAVCPLSTLGPAVFLLVLVSALAFENPAAGVGSVKYALLESSTVSGILHASLYLESVVMPYYTGLDALVASALSGECPTCVCRREALVVGGGVVSFRAWSPATFAVVGTLCSRLACVLFGEERPMSSVAKPTLEGLAWVLVAMDCLYLAARSPTAGGDVVETAAYGAVCVLMCVTMLGRVVCTLLACLPTLARPRKKERLPCPSSV